VWSHSSSARPATACRQPEEAVVEERPEALIFVLLGQLRHEIVGQEQSMFEQELPVRLAELFERAFPESVSLDQHGFQVRDMLSRRP